MTDPVLNRFLWSDGSRSTAYLLEVGENTLTIAEGRPDFTPKVVSLNNEGNGKFPVAWEPVPEGDSL